jgi:hypothetical protein
MGLMAIKGIVNSTTVRGISSYYGNPHTTGIHADEVGLEVCQTGAPIGIQV